MYMEAGFDDYLTKPIDTGKLENMLLSYLPEDLINNPIESNQTGSSDNDKASLHTLLVVNEDVQILRQIKEWLSSEYDIAVVKSSEQALAYLKNHEPDLILTNLDESLTYLEENLNIQSLDVLKKKIVQIKSDRINEEEIKLQVREYFEKH